MTKMLRLKGRLEIRYKIIELNNKILKLLKPESKLKWSLALSLIRLCDFSTTMINFFSIFIWTKLMESPRPTTTKFVHDSSLIILISLYWGRLSPHNLLWSKTSSNSSISTMVMPNELQISKQIYAYPYSRKLNDANINHHLFLHKPLNSQRRRHPQTISDLVNRNHGRGNMIGI